MSVTSASTSAAASADTAALYQQLQGSASSSANATTESADRFLKLLVAQMKNQDPLSPMDNAQVTSQMAQINTVSGLDKVNQSIQSMSAQFLQMQAMQSASLVGRDVLVAGKALTLEDGKAQAAFDLAGAADSVKVEVLNGAGRVVDTLDLGAETSGRHAFTWNAPEALKDGSGYTFRVAAASGAKAVTATTLARDQVQSVSSNGGTLTLQLASGSAVAYADVKAFSN
jgi:flagellar basal-body rod modification protein FlgD